MSRTVLLVALAGVACAPPGRQPLTDDTAAFDSDVADSARETGLWPDTDTDPWLDTGVDTSESDTQIVETDVACPPGWEVDCSGNCSSLALVGDGFCDQGPSPKADFFSCGDFDFDGGDCVVDTAPDTDLCPFEGEVPDCNGNCFASFLVGDGDCNDGPAPGVDFACEQFENDGGDCTVDTDPDTQVVDTDTAVDTDAIALPCAAPLEIRDCNAVCWPEAWLGDDRCDDGASHVWGDPDFDCAFYQHDLGDCPDTDLPVETADTSAPVDTDLPTDSDTDLPVDSDTDLPTDSDTDVVDTVVPADSDTDVVVDTVVPTDSDTDVTDTVVADTVVTDTVVTDTVVTDTVVPPP